MPKNDRNGVSQMPSFSESLIVLFRRWRGFCNRENWGCSIPIRFWARVRVANEVCESLTNLPIGQEVPDWGKKSCISRNRITDRQGRVCLIGRVSRLGAQWTFRGSVRIYPSELAMFAGIRPFILFWLTGFAALAATSVSYAQDESEDRAPPTVIGKIRSQSTPKPRSTTPSTPTENKGG